MKTNFKKVALGYIFTLPGDKKAVYKKVSNTKAVKFSPGHASKTKQSFKASDVVLRNK